MKRSQSNLEEFMASLEGMNIHIDEESLSHESQRTIDSVFGHVKTFLTEHNMVPADQLSSLESFNQPVRRLNGDVSILSLGGDEIATLCRECGIGDRYLKAAVESVALCIDNYGKDYNASKHFSSSTPSSGHSDCELRGFDTMYSEFAVNNLVTSMSSAVESFGADIANTISDAKVAITVSILRYHRSALHRLIPNIPTDNNLVSYDVDAMEVYDLTKSRSSEAAVRYEDRHRIPFVDLYRDPSPANTQLKPIVLRVANDGIGPAAKLIAEDIVKIGTSINMFDYSIDAGTVGYSHIDYTDLVADNVRIKTLYASITDGDTTETIPLNVYDHSGSRMMMSANNMDSADRICALESVLALDATQLNTDGEISTLLAGLTTDGIIRVKFNAAGSVNLKTSNMTVHGQLSATIATKSGNDVVVNDQTLFDSLTITMLAYTPAAEFSEENIRKTTKAMRIMTKTVAYEIPGSANYIVQYSLTQTRPEVVIDGLTKLMSIGIDDRGIKLIKDTLANVRDRINAEANLSEDNYVYKVGQSFVAGQRVKPYVFMDTMVIDENLKNMRSGEKWGDIRGYAEEYLLNVLSRLYRESFYSQELGAGEKPVFTVLTSIPIKSSLLSVPHYHSHLGDSAKDAVNDGVVEFRRTLPDGTVLNVITTTFEYMDDKILMIPVRPNRPQSSLNFGQNRERGTYLTQATPTVDNAIINSLIGNAREFPIITNPVGALITVSGLHAVFDGIGLLGSMAEI